MAALVGPLTGVSQAGPYQNANFQVEGTVHAVGDPRPHVAGTTGSFVLEDLTDARPGGIQGAIDEDGRVTIDVQPGTTFMADPDGDGQHARSTFAETVVPGESVYVTGRFQRVDDEVVLFASYVFNPRPATLPEPPPANPTPQLPRDMVINRVYGLRGALHNPSANLALGTARTKAGFELRDIQTGCDEGYCHIDAIAAAHRGALTFTETELTQYWVQGPDGRHQRTTNRFLAIESRGIGAEMLVTGRYFWDGTDWRFLVSHVFSPPPGSAGGSEPGPLGPYNGGAVEGSAGSEDPVTGGRLGTEWHGTIDSGGPIAGARIYLNLDWHEGVDGVWVFTGTYSILTANPGGTGFEGEITGTVTPGVPGRLNADLTIVEGYGNWSTYEGVGSWRGGATFGPDGRPVQAHGSFLWEVVNT